MAGTETTPVGSASDPYLNGDANYSAQQLLASLGITSVSYPTPLTPNPGVATVTGNPGGVTIEVALGDQPETFNAQNYTGSTPLILVGNDAGDTFNVAGSTNVDIVEGAGDDTVNDPGSNITLYTSTGTTTFNASGNDTVNQLDPLHDDAQVKINVANNGVLTLGTTSGNDTVTAFGNATVFGGSGAFTFFGATGGTSVVHGGSGNETLLGGTDGVNTFYAGSGNDSLVGGSFGTNNLYAGTGTDTLYGGSDAANTFYGGKGFDELYAGSGGTNVFEFSANSSVSGGTTVINNTTLAGFQSASDQIVLQGYNSSQVTLTANGGNTYIKLTDGTTIKIVGVSLTDESTAVSHGYIKFTS